MKALDKSLIRSIPNFPKTGIEFKDITPLLADPQAYSEVIDMYAAKANNCKFVVGIEARGFIFAAATALLKA
ncbi:MAG: adenine phosphoribosyltransferase, partial [Actinobacteria bacterium]|nr:adenine phosphoribosyltransferase [Actinomycetota bacterium]